MYKLGIAAMAAMMFCGITSANEIQRAFLPGIWHTTVKQFLVKGESWFVFEQDGSCRQYSRGSIAGIEQQREISCAWVLEENTLVLKVHDSRSAPDVDGKTIRASIKRLGNNSMELSEGRKTQTWARVEAMPPEYRQ